MVTPISPLAQNELCVVFSSSSALVACSECRRLFWSSYNFSQKSKDYSISFDAFTDAENSLKETFLSFSNSEIHCRDIAEVKSSHERNRPFGIVLVLPLFVVCDFSYSHTG